MMSKCWTKDRRPLSRISRAGSMGTAASASAGCITTFGHPLGHWPATAAALGQSFGDQLWQGVERASWIAALVGAIGIVVVIAEIRQLLRRPRLKLGFAYDPGGAEVRKTAVRNEETIKTTWPAGSALSEPIELTVSAFNEGSATAQDVVLEVRYPRWLEPVGRNDLKEIPAVNAWSLVKSASALNPGLGLWIKATFQVPQGKTTFKLHVIVSQQDSREIEKTLTVKLE
jgi:hypothetical protein